MKLGRDKMKEAHGTHVMIDYTGFFPLIDGLGNWVLSLMEDAIDSSDARRVHSHIEEFDGTKSPPGFAAVVLLDESHFSAHCYSDKGWLAVDCFTCGGTDAEGIVDRFHQKLTKSISSLKLEKRSVESRFIHGGE